MKLHFYLSAIAIGTIAISSCKKTEPIIKNNKAATTQASADTDVYAAGYVYENTDGLGPWGHTPVYWKNGVFTQLSDTSGAGYANGIAMQKGNVIISGEVAGPANGESAVYWRNGALTVLATNAVASDVYVTMCSCDFYIAGNINMGPRPDYQTAHACYWKDGVIHMLPINGIYATANAITLSGTDVYATGMAIAYNNQPYAVYWKNDVLYKLTDTIGDDVASGNSIAVSGNDVYIVGQVNGAPACWKNGVLVSLGGNTPQNHLGNAEGVAVQGSDVYAAGAESSDGQSVYWKNGVPVPLSSNAYYAYIPNSIISSGNNIYISGRVQNTSSPSIPAYWKNGVLTTLPYNTGTGGSVLAVATALNK